MIWVYVVLYFALLYFRQSTVFEAFLCLCFCVLNCVLLHFRIFVFVLYVELCLGFYCILMYFIIFYCILLYFVFV